MRWHLAAVRNVGYFFAIALLAAPYGHASVTPIGKAGASECFCELAGTVDDCCCTVADADAVSTQAHGIVKQLETRAFFRFYQVNLARTCRFWRSDGACMYKSCAVEPCTAAELASGGLGEVDDLLHSGDCVAPLPRTPDAQQPHGAVMDTISDTDKAAFEAWQAHDARRLDFCGVVEDDVSAEAIHVNLIDNPERFTGYIGDSPRKVWRAIYEENCFRPEDSSVPFLTTAVVNGMCKEKRVFFRIISGLHACINMHVAAAFPGPPTGFPPAVTWHPNVTYFERLFSPEHTFGDGPSRLKNIYFTYLLLLRAITKAAPLWTPAVFHTGHAADDAGTVALVQRLLTVAGKCPSTFDETELFAADDAGADALREKFVTLFRNVSAIMDCVDCEKCRMWGKLQIHGLGVALKILFFPVGDAQSAVKNDWVTQIALKRNDLAALFNTFFRFSQALDELAMFKHLVVHQ